jgi:hypothetical protein
LALQRRCIKTIRMRKLLKLTLFIVFFCGTSVLKAQSIVTEYFPISGVFTFNAKDKRIQKLMSEKGVLTIDFDGDKRILTIVYPSKNQVDVKAVVEDVKKFFKP